MVDVVLGCARRLTTAGFITPVPSVVGAVEVPPEVPVLPSDPEVPDPADPEPAVPAFTVFNSAFNAVISAAI